MRLKTYSESIPKGLPNGMLTLGIAEGKAENWVPCTFLRCDVSHDCGNTCPSFSGSLEAALLYANTVQADGYGTLIYTCSYVRTNISKYNLPVYQVETLTLLCQYR